jgi:lactoylglutathione lyase
VFLANSEGETCVEVIDNPEAENSGNANLSIGFHAEDVEALREQLQQEGLSPTPMITPVPGVRFFFVKDPAGVNVQFI